MSLVSILCGLVMVDALHQNVSISDKPAAHLCVCAQVPASPAHALKVCWCCLATRTCRFLGPCRPVPGALHSQTPRGAGVAQGALRVLRGWVLPLPGRCSSALPNLGVAANSPCIPVSCLSFSFIRNLVFLRQDLKDWGQTT